MATTRKNTWKKTTITRGEAEELEEVLKECIDSTPSIKLTKLLRSFKVPAGVTAAIKERCWDLIRDIASLRDEPCRDTVELVGESCKRFDEFLEKIFTVTDGPVNRTVKYKWQVWS